MQQNETEPFIKRCSNINLAWASLVVEECVRLGFTYFCIAPGSRSSPLALSATCHPLTTCISCYDERSLGFHALGYGRGSRKPAVVITSSGTAVSNLLPSVSGKFLFLKSAPFPYSSILSLHLYDCFSLSNPTSLDN